MTEEDKKHWFDLGKRTERSERTFFNSKEFWLGILIGILIGYLIIAFDL